MSSANSVICVNGSLDKAPIKFFLDSGAAISVVNYDVVRQKAIIKATTCAAGANGALWM